MANAQMLADYLFLQELVEARIAAQIGDQLDVQPINQLEDIAGKNLPRDTVFVYWDGERIPDDAAGGASTMTQQLYTVLLAKRNARQVKGALNTSAGPQLSALHKAIAGWAPPGAMRPFRRASAGRRPYYGTNVALYPLTFSISLTL
jgi:hypothetical protein